MSKSIKVTIGLIIIIPTFFVLFLFILRDNKFIGYVNFKEARNSSNTVQVYGFYINEIGKPTDIDIHENTLSFFMRDDVGNEMKVVWENYDKSDIENSALPDKKEPLVVKGKVIDNVFYAKEVFTKCPDKYKIVLKK